MDEMSFIEKLMVFGLTRQEASILSVSVQKWYIDRL